MVICYREVYKLEVIVDLYENVRKNCLDNEDILFVLFMVYVRLGDYKKQQQTVMLFYRLQFNKNSCYFWAVMSIVMQSQSSDDEKLVKGMFFFLVERMVKKYVDEKKINAEEEVQMYLIILNLMGKWKEVYEVVIGFFGEKLISEIFYKERKVVELFLKMNNWLEVNVKFKFLLKENLDYWQYWKDYISFCIKIVKLNWQLQDDGNNCEIDYIIDMVFLFMD